MDSNNSKSPDPTLNIQGSPIDQNVLSVHADSVSEPTQVIAAQSAAIVGGEDPLADAASRQKLEADLTRMGVSKAEIHRILNTKGDSAAELQKTTAFQAKPNSAVNFPSSKPSKPSRPTVDDLHSFAAQLMQQNSAAAVKKIDDVVLELPEFRESTGEEIRRGEVLLREAQMLRKREHYQEAEAKCREALDLIPKDAAALEYLGDLLQGLARIDEALAVYKRALLADPKRYSAEKKYGDLLVRQQNWSAPDENSIPRNGFAAVLLSALFPGAGQLHNGDTTKGIFFIAAFLISVFIVGWSPYGLKSEHVKQGLNMSFLVSAVFMGVIYIAAMIDANSGAKNRNL